MKLWSTLPVGVDRKEPLTKLYPPEVISSIVAGLDSAKRWGVAEGQLTAASKVVNSQIINQFVRRYIDDEISAEEAARSINEELAKL